MAVVLERLVIENFQSLRDRTEIPLRQITLLYGPNSAGKSAVLDALKMIRLVLRGSEQEVGAHARRWCHRRTGPAERMAPIRLRLDMCSYVAFSAVDSDAGVKVWGQMPEAFEECEDKGILEDRCAHRIGLDLTVPADDGEIGLSIELDGKVALRLEWAEDRTSHLATISPEPFGQVLFALAGAYNVDHEHAKAFVCETFLHLGPFSLSRGVALDPHWVDYENSLLRIASFLIDRTAELLPSPYEVEADRGIIDDDALTVTGCSSDIDNGLGHARLGLPDEFTRAPHSTPVTTYDDAGLIGQLALGWLSAEARRVVGKRPWPADLEIQHTDVNLKSVREMARLTAIVEGNRAAVGGRYLHDYLNDCLARHLFLDRGYVLRFDLCEIRPAPNSPAARTVWSDHWAEDKSVGGDLRLAGIVNIWLADGQGRALRFRDVGSGLSCVLPVLGALWGAFSFIQQPELHLHPALQGALADVVIETTHRGGPVPQVGEPISGELGPNCHILETHSEFLLLRCLRRMRQTAGGRQPEGSSLSLTPEQIAVLYFDPQPDGSTRVKRIRLTPDGEFVDRWPRGFFEERGRDLFDE